MISYEEYLWYKNLYSGALEERHVDNQNLRTLTRDEWDSAHSDARIGVIVWLKVQLLDMNVAFKEYVCQPLKEAPLMHYEQTHGSAW